MAQTTKIKKDLLGLYVIAGGWISRPPNMDNSLTIFKDGDKVKTHHFGGSVIAGVTFESENFKHDGNYEIWITTGIINLNYKTMSQSEIKSETFSLFNQHTTNTAPYMYLRNNIDFKNKFLLKPDA